jgi:hypothetical protein
MNISDEQLAAYLDGELSAEDKAAVAAAVAADPELAHQVAAQQALRDRVRRAFDGTLGEPVPQRLLDAVRSSPRIDPETAGARRRRPWIAPTVWLAAAASITLAILVAPRLLQRLNDESNIIMIGSNRTAGGELARALSLQLASEQSSRDVQLGVSFVAKSGEYCRTFIAAQNEGSVAGFACHEQDSWRVDVLEPVADSMGDRAAYRQAASALPPLVLQAVEARMVGEALDATGEARARDNGWKPVTASDRSPPAQ